MDDTIEAKRKPRCWLRFGHRYDQVGRGFECRRCGKPAETCDNCGRQHDPNAITICIVQRG